MNYLQKSIVISGFLFSAPAFAHGNGLVLFFIGFPLLAALYSYVSWQLKASLEHYDCRENNFYAFIHLNEWDR